MDRNGSGSQTGRHVIEGEYIHNDVVYCSYFPKETIETLYGYNYNPDDIILATYPKCGTTWMQEIIYGIVHCDDLADLDELVPTNINKRFPFIELGEGVYKGLEVLEEMSFPRLIKTHLCKKFFDIPLRQKNKIVIVLRNVKDAIVSYYHFYQHIEGFAFKGHDFDEFFELFRDKHLCFGDWYDWVLNWWKEKDNPNICFVFYEDMKENIHKETRKVAEFLGKDLTAEQLQLVVDRAHFDKMKKNRMAVDEMEKEGVGRLRKGVVGDWRSHFSEEQAQFVDTLTAEKLDGTGLQFKDF